MRDIIKTDKGFVLVIIHINHAQSLLGSPQPQNKENYSLMFIITREKYKGKKVPIDCNKNERKPATISRAIRSASKMIIKLREN